MAVVDKNVLALDARRPWLPSAAVKWIDQRRGLWMYPSGGPVQERWFVSKWLQREIARSGFGQSRVESLMTPAERRRWVFRAIPAARLMTLWSASVPDMLEDVSDELRKPKRMADRGIANRKEIRLG